MPTDAALRHNLQIQGDGPATLLFVHGLGTGQWVWREMAPVFSQRFRVALMDLAGCGAADRAAYDPPRYATLQGHAQDLEAVARTLRPGRVVLVVHSVAAMVGLLADLNAPDLFDAHVMVAPSPCYLNLPGYRGGFDLPDLQASLNLMDVNLPVWVNAMAPGLMGGPHGDPLTQELAASLHRTAAAPLRQFAHVTFMGDYRQRLTELVKPVAVLQASDDTIAPQDVGRFMHRKLPDCSLNVVPCSGHFPQLRNAGACIAAMGKFLSGLGLAGGMASAIR